MGLDEGQVWKRRRRTLQRGLGGRRVSTYLQK